MRVLLKALAALALLQAGTAAPAAVQAQASDEEARLEQARALVALINPVDLMVEANLEGWEAGIRQSIALDPTVQALEAEYQGVGKAAIEAGRPLAREYSKVFVARASERKAALFAQRMSLTELKEASAFFSTPAGRRVVAGMTANSDTDQIVTDAAAQAAETGKMVISADAVAQSQHKAVRATMGQISAEDQVAVLRFGLTEASKKLAAAAAEADREIMEMVNNPDPVWIERQNDLVGKAMLDFIDGKEPR